MLAEAMLFLLIMNSQNFLVLWLIFFLLTIQVPLMMS